MIILNDIRNVLDNKILLSKTEKLIASKIVASLRVDDYALKR